MLGKQSFYKVFSNDSYDQLKFHIFAWLGLNPDCAPALNWTEVDFAQKSKCSRLDLDWSCGCLQTKWCRKSWIWKKLVKWQETYIVIRTMKIKNIAMILKMGIATYGFWPTLTKTWWRSCITKLQWVEAGAFWAKTCVPLKIFLSYSSGSRNFTYCLLSKIWLWLIVFTTLGRNIIYLLVIFSSVQFSFGFFQVLKLCNEFTWKFSDHPETTRTRFS